MFGVHHPPTTPGFRLAASLLANGTTPFSPYSRVTLPLQANHRRGAAFHASTTSLIRATTPLLANRHPDVFGRVGTTPGLRLNPPPIPPQASRHPDAACRACTTTGFSLATPPQANRRLGEVFRRRHTIGGPPKHPLLVQRSLEQARADEMDKSVCISCNGCSSNNRAYKSRPQRRPPAGLRAVKVTL
jgi:hypothetical protein